MSIDTELLIVMRRFALLVILLAVLLAVSTVDVLGAISPGVKTADWTTCTDNISNYLLVDPDLKSTSMGITDVESDTASKGASEFIICTIYSTQISSNLIEGVLDDAIFSSHLTNRDLLCDTYPCNITDDKPAQMIATAIERPDDGYSTATTNYVWNHKTEVITYAKISEQTSSLEDSIDKTSRTSLLSLTFTPPYFYSVLSVVAMLIIILTSLCAIWIRQKKQRPLLFALEVAGAIFTAVFLFAYLGGLFMTPTTTVLHSELPVRIALIVAGAALLTLIMANILMGLREKTLKSVSVLKAGLLIVATAYFLFNLHSLFTLEWVGEWERIGGGSLFTIILIQDLSAFGGIIARFIAGIMALMSAVIYFRRGLPSTQKLCRTIRWILVLEAVYWFALIPTAVSLAYIAVIFYGSATVGLLGNLAWTTIPVFVESMVLPSALIVLAKKLDYKKPSVDAIRWAWISGVFLIVVFWLTNMGTWMLTVGTKGLGYLAYPQNMFSFILTAGGLIALVLYTVYFAKKRGFASAWQSLNLRGVGIIMTLLGLFFLLNYLNWIFFGGDYIWSTWYAWFLGHNLDLWMLTLPLVGIPLMLYRPERT